ncbi:hypothetical protein B0T09DRAFT_20679 [Sordaria sp. MPI-SDFR-AT-0083]|nr:hypothetical protein B0T09DRAFT_20679 [Sordaria sp. MPI-SDFR-AT-0083]
MHVSIPCLWFHVLEWFADLCIITVMISWGIHDKTILVVGLVSQLSGCAALLSAS